MPTRLLVFALLLAPGLAAQAQQTVRPGDTVNGALTENDAIFETDGSYYDLYVVRASPGEEIEIALISEDFDAFLLGGDTEAGAFDGEYTDDDSAGDTDASLLVTVGASGQFWFLANSYGPDETGDYVLIVQSISGGDAGSGFDDVLRSGDSVSGRLDTSDEQLPDGSYVDVYTYEGSPGETLTVTLSSGDFDAYLSGGRMENGTFVFDASDDDSGGGTDAQLVVEVGYTGQYVIRANSLGSGETGSYTLSVEGSGGGGLAEADVIRPGESASGSLASGDATLPDGSFYDLYEVVASPNEALEITLASTDFDAYLAGGTTPDGAFAIEVSDDDGAGGTNAMLKVQAGADGRFYVLANMYQAGGSGRYTLSVRGVGGGDDTELPTLALGSSVSGELTADDPVLSADNTHFDVYAFQGSPGQEVEITLTSADFDAYLLLFRSFGGELEKVTEDDDGAGGTNARIRTTLDRSGTYLIAANTFVAGATGSYSLSLDRPGTAPDASTGLPALLTGQSTSGTLSASDNVLADNSYVDLYAYRGNPGDRVTVTMRSSDFNAYLSIGTLAGEEFQLVGSDDNSGGGTDARYAFTVEGNGTYVIRANSLAAGETGAYSLVVERSSATPQTTNQGNSRFAGKWAPSTYEPSSSYSSVRNDVIAARRLEATSTALNASFPLPRNVPISFEECGMINAQYRWRGTEGSVRFCYELMEYLHEVLEPQVGADRLTEAVNGAYEFIMLHEAGHALNHQLDLPITGREEDVADQFAALTLIRQGNKGARAAIDGVLALQSGGSFTQSDYADEHSLGPQRLYNVVCLVYGSDPAKYANLVGPDGLPEERAVRCEGEYAQVEKAFDRLLGFVYNE